MPRTNLLPAGPGGDLPDRLSVVEYRLLLAGGITVKPKRRQTPEEDLHRACFAWIGLLTPRHPILRWMVHYPAGGKRPKGEAGKLKALGTKPGVPDLMIPRPHRGRTGLAVELKSPTGSVSGDQKGWLSALEDDGYLTAVYRSLEEFQAVVMRFLEGKP